MSEPDPVFESQVSDATREDLRAKLGQLLRDAEALDVDLGRLSTRVGKIFEADYVPVTDAIGRAADHLGDAIDELEAILDDFD
jgi:hypothetical protein